MIVLRPHAGVRAAGPALIVVGVLGVLTVSPVLAVLVVAGLALLPALVERVECDGAMLRRRRIRGWSGSLPLAVVVGLRLRRVPFSFTRRWRHRYRIGPFSSLPVRLRLLTRTGVGFEIMTGWWAGWRALARFVETLPDVEIDARSRARLERAGP